MHEGAEPLLAVGLVDGHAQVFRYRAREEGESSSSSSSDDSDDDDDDDAEGEQGEEGAAAERRRRERRRKQRLAAAARNDQPPVRRYASSLAWSRAASSSSGQGAEDPSCRAVRFMGGGGESGPLLLACGYGDGSLAALDAAAGGREVWRSGPNAHGAAVSRVLPAPGLGGGASDRLLVAGDEDGVLCVWDLRSKGGGGGGGGKVGGGKGAAAAAAASAAATPAVRCAEHTDFISDLCAGGPRRPHMLLATSGDGTLSVHDVRAASSNSASAAAAAGSGGSKKTGAAARRRADGLVARSEPGGADDELLSVAVARGGGKVVAGGQSGVLSIFSWGEWEDPSDRFPGHPESVDALAAVDGDTLLTGSSDGLIRVIGLLPNRLLGVLGVHGDDGSPVERLAVGGNGGGEGACPGLRALASSGHGECVRLWDLGCFFEEDDDEEGEDGEEDKERQEAAAGAAAAKGEKKKKQLQEDPGAAVLAAAAPAAAKRTDAGRASSDSSESDSDSDSDSDEDERAGKRRKPERTRMTKQTRDGGLAAKQQAGFFAGLLDD